MILSIDPVVHALLGNYYGGPFSNRTFAGNWTQGDNASVVTLYAHQQYGTDVLFRFTATLDMPGLACRDAPTVVLPPPGHRHTSQPAIGVTNPVPTLPATAAPWASATPPVLITPTPDATFALEPATLWMGGPIEVRAAPPDYSSTAGKVCTTGFAVSRDSSQWLLTAQHRLGRNRFVNIWKPM